MLFLYGKLSKPADKDIVTILQGLLDQLEKGFNDLG